MKFKFSECCTLDSKLMMSYGKWLSAIQFTSIRRRRCKSLALYHRSPMVVQWRKKTGIVIGKLQVSVLRSLEYVLALIVNCYPPEFLGDIWKAKPLHKEISLFKKKLYGAGSVGPESGTRNDCGFIRKSQNHYFTTNYLMHGAWMTRRDKKHICSGEGSI